ncbi:hypothetical protein DFS34DRAFT_590141 [Phlyctochytrium arcticum]|nr:hypothetical protein DFS34DRAFT_590141 [Phlyctochytrium arcticum]
MGLETGPTVGISAAAVLLVVVIFCCIAKRRNDKTGKTKQARDRADVARNLSFDTSANKDLEGGVQQGERLKVDQLAAAEAGLSNITLASASSEPSPKALSPTKANAESDSDDDNKPLEMSLRTHQSMTSRRGSNATTTSSPTTNNNNHIVNMDGKTKQLHNALSASSIGSSPSDVATLPPHNINSRTSMDSQRGNTRSSSRDTAASGRTVLENLTKRSTSLNANSAATNPLTHQSSTGIVQPRLTGLQIATQSYYRRQGDEITVRAGDPVSITTAYSDGWCFGMNWQSAQSGVFPLLAISSEEAERIAREHPETISRPPKDLVRPSADGPRSISLTRQQLVTPPVSVVAPSETGSNTEQTAPDQEPSRASLLYSHPSPSAILLGRPHAGSDSATSAANTSATHWGVRELKTSQQRRESARESAERGRSRNRVNSGGARSPASNSSSDPLSATPPAEADDPVVSDLAAMHWAAISMLDAEQHALAQEEQQRKRLTQQQGRKSRTNRYTSSPTANPYTPLTRHAESLSQTIQAAPAHPKTSELQHQAGQLIQELVEADPSQPTMKSKASAASLSVPAARKSLIKLHADVESIFAEIFGQQDVPPVPPIPVSVLTSTLSSPTTTKSDLSPPPQSVRSSSEGEEVAYQTESSIDFDMGPRRSLSINLVHDPASLGPSHLGTVIETPRSSLVSEIHSNPDVADAEEEDSDEPIAQDSSPSPPPAPLNTILPPQTDELQQPDTRSIHTRRSSFGHRSNYTTAESEAFHTAGESASSRSSAKSSLSDLSLQGHDLPFVDGYFPPGARGDTASVSSAGTIPAPIQTPLNPPAPRPDSPSDNDDEADHSDDDAVTVIINGDDEPSPPSDTVQV